MGELYVNYISIKLWKMHGKSLECPIKNLGKNHRAHPKKAEGRTTGPKKVLHSNQQKMTMVLRQKKKCYLKRWWQSNMDKKLSIQGYGQKPHYKTGLKRSLPPRGLLRKMPPSHHPWCHLHTRTWPCQHATSIASSYSFKISLWTEPRSSFRTLQ